MRIKFLILTAIAVALASCATSAKGLEEESLNGKSKRAKVVELLNSIENGDRAPAAYINPEKYIQHNQAVADGLAGFGEVLEALNGEGRVRIVRAFEDGDYVFTHTEYDFFGPKAGFDIFRFEEGLIVEHWDNLQEIAEESVSGRTQFDGPVEIRDLDRTDENKSLIEGFIHDILMGADPGKISEYISPRGYAQHNPGVADGIEGIAQAMAALADAGMPMVYDENHMILGEGNFVLSVSEGRFMNRHVSFYDLFRIENGLIVEHWDTIEEIPEESERMNGNGKF